MTVLRAAGVESESEIPFAGLLDAAAARARTGSTSCPRRRPPRCARALGLAAGAGGDRFLIGAATLSLLAACAEHAPGAGRDRRRPVDRRVLARARSCSPPGACSPTRSRCVIATPRRRRDRPARRSRCAGLDRAAAAAVLERHAGRPLPPGAADRVFEATLGNPLALVELAARPPSCRSSPPLPVETSVEHAFARADRARCPEPARRLLRAGARPRTRGRRSRVARTAAGGAALGARRSRARSARGRARAACVDASRARPARRSAIRSRARPPTAAAAPDERRAAHARARAAPSRTPTGGRGTGRRRRSGRTRRRPTTLEGAGRRARDRGAYTAAASSLERAARLTADPPDPRAAAVRGRRGGVARRPRRARRASASPRRRDALRGPRAARRDRPAARARRAARRARDGRRTTSSSPRPRQRRAGQRRRDARRGDRGLPVRAPSRGPMLRRRAPGLGGARPRRPASARASSRDARARHGADLHRQGEDGRRAAARGDRRSSSAPTRSRPTRTLLASAAPGALWLREARARARAGRRARSRRRAPPGRDRRAAVRAVAGGPRRGDLATGSRVAVALLRGGDPARARDRAGDRAVRRARRAGVRRGAPGPRGRVPGARRARRSSWPSALGLAFFELWALDALADLELGLRERRSGRRAPAPRRSACSTERGIADPDPSPAPELVEALLRLDRVAEAARRLEAFAEAAEAKGQPWSLARLRAGPRAARRSGRLRGGAARCTPRTPDRFEEARTLLCQGEALRRARRRAEAREPLRRAIDAFDALGAAPWAERARRELQASGETARRRDPLHARRAHAARAAGRARARRGPHDPRGGRRSSSSAPRPSTTTCSHVYRKLAIDSRAALADALQPRPGAPPDASARRRARSVAPWRHRRSTMAKVERSWARRSASSARR